MFQNFMHYQSILNKHRERWTPAEDKKLCTAVKKLRQGKFIPWIKVHNTKYGEVILFCIILLFQ